MISDLAFILTIFSIAFILGAVAALTQNKILAVIWEIVSIVALALNSYLLINLIVKGLS